jgi:hypothetical protein
MRELLRLHIPQMSVVILWNLWILKKEKIFIIWTAKDWRSSRTETGMPIHHFPPRRTLMLKFGIENKSDSGAAVATI